MTRLPVLVAGGFVLALVGCSARSVPPPTVVRIVEPVEVKVPVLVHRTPPAELLATLHPPLPVFVAPDDPLASSALTVEGERLFRGLVADMRGRIQAWEAWAAEGQCDEPRTQTAVAVPVESRDRPTGREVWTIPGRSRRLLTAALVAVGVRSDP